MKKGLTYKQNLPTIVAKPSIVKNMFFPGVPGSGVPNYSTAQIYSGIQNDPKNLNKWRGPVQVLRLKVDLSVLKDAVMEAERPAPSLPYRVIMQTIFLNTIDNGHVFACIQRRKNLTLLKRFHICDDNDVTDEAATELLNTSWFHLMRNYIHDAIYYGYTLFSFGDMVDNAFPNINLQRRTDVSPDRLNLASFQYIPTGIQFMEGDHYGWSLYVPTPTENGVSKCGYGLLYKAAPYEIIIRTITGWNVDYTERYGQPTTVIKTVKDNEEERTRAEEAAQKLGSSGYLILDKMDEFELVNGDNGGTGWKSYDNLELRCKKTISTIILGHEDAITSTPGKLGGGQGGEESSAAQALDECESIDTKFEENIVNNILIPKLQKLGIKIPVGKKYKLKNDKEIDEENFKDSRKAQAWANVAVSMSQSGLKIDSKDFEDKTGLKTEKVLVAEDKPSPFNPKLKEKLNKIYGKVGCK